MVGMPSKVRVLTTAAAVVFGVAACSGNGNSNNSVGNGYQDGDGAIAHYAVGDRKMVGDVVGETLQGKPLNLASYRGKVVVVDFWSNSCGPCHGEEQAFEALSKEYADKGVQFVGIDERDNRSYALGFERQYHVTYPSLYDRNDAYLLDFPGAAPPSTPTTIILDPTGHIAARVNGALDYTHLKTLITSALSEKT
jgi:thiol-disulfide isomerase/thioredoxin